MAKDLLEEAKKIMGDQFNEKSWKNLIKEDPKKAEKQLADLAKFIKKS